MILKYLQENWLQIISSIGFGTLISTIIGLVRSNKRNTLEYITKERSEWRREMKSIIVDLLDGRNRKSAISRLKTQINPYGIDFSNKFTDDYYMSDGHIWDLLKNFHYSESETIKLTGYLELLLKYDWERSKEEIKYKIPDICYNLIRVISVMILGIGAFTSSSSTWLICLDLCSIFLLVIQDFIENSWKADSFVSSKKRLGWIIVAYIIPYLYAIVRMIYIWKGTFPFNEKNIFLLIVVAIPSVVYVFLKHWEKQRYLAKLRNIEFKNPEITEQSNKLYDEINYLRNQLHKFDYQITDDDLSELKNKRDRLESELKKKQKEKLK
ncbi:hypothetical protein ABZ559_09205 [Streptococcus sp. ZY19097]|uniref:hypothetical protein n=1 Tax=Streptococcus sp. ZY19097 TaxID=3231906 RepID=UPI003458C056